MASNPSCICIKDVIFGCCVAAHKTPSNLWGRKRCIGRSSIRGDNYGASGTHHKSPYYSASKLSSPYINDMPSSLLTPRLTEHSRPSGDGPSTVVVLRSLVHLTAYLLAQGSDAPSMSMTMVCMRIWLEGLIQLAVMNGQWTEALITRLTMPSRSVVEIPGPSELSREHIRISSIEEFTRLVSCKRYLVLQSPGERPWSSLPHNSPRLKCASWAFKAQGCQFQFITNEEYVGLK